MSDMTLPGTGAWSAVVARVRAELAVLPAAERAWLEQRLAAISGLQLELDRLFTAAGGMLACAACQGGCCGCGRHHFTLTNLLAYLCRETAPPEPDLAGSCPYLGEHGCRLDAARRPFNCITFFCETLDNRLAPAEREQLARLESALRGEYEAVAGRYPAASLRGLWIALERHGAGSLLQGRVPVC